MGETVFMIAPTPFFAERGCHVRVLDSYLRLGKDDHVALFTYGLGRTPAPVKDIVRVYNFPWYKKTSPGPSLTKLFYDVLLFVKLVRRSMKTRPDVYYCHLHEGAALGLMLRFFFKGKVVFDNQGLLAGELSSSWLGKGIVGKVLSAIEKMIIRRCDSTIVSSQGLHDKIKERYGFETTVVTDVPNPAIFNPKAQPADVPLPKDKTIIVYLGGLQKGKGMQEFMRIIPSLDKRFFFLIMGYPVEECKALAKELGIEDKVMFTGPIKYEESPSYLRLGDYALSPKRTESGEANAKLYTYKALGLKTICFDAPENRAILDDDGIYAKGDSAEAFKTAFACLRTTRR